MKALVVELELHWGFSVKKPLESAAQEPLAYPPPTTLVGALARGLVRARRLGELVHEDNRLYSAAAVALRRVVYAAACAKGRLVRYQDISRNIAAVYMRPVHRRDRMNWFAAQGMGKVYGPKTRLIAVYVVGEEDDELLTAAYAMQALGSKEGLVSVVDARFADVEVLDEDFVEETPFYAPVRAVESCEGAIVEEFWDLDAGSYEYPSRRLARLKPYYVPNQPSYTSLTNVYVSEDGAVVRVEDYELVVERGVVEG